ncbi:MAG: 3-hydroxyacyl-ACP dehydratase [Paludibacteraceae bacterium]|nr:3-hydroxyacyl-ACP dehydratase [Paludibacteraceae bacterium]
MKLQNDFYEIQSERKTENGGVYELKLNAEHFVYKAHFPSQPITPGVCVLQMAVELFSTCLQKEIRLVKVNNLKFTSILSPVETPFVTYAFQKITEENGLLKAQILVEQNSVVYAKISITCTVA